MIATEPLIEGAAEGPVLKFTDPISFWGGIDPATGRVTDPQHHAHGQNIAGSVLVLAATRGSSSSSAVMLELMRGGNAPAALVLAEIDAILSLGVVVAKEMDYGSIPVFRLPIEDHRKLATGQFAKLAADGSVTLT